MNYDRPSERADVARPVQNTRRIDFWAIVETPPGEGEGIGSAEVSPVFGTQAELTGWVRTRRGQLVNAWKREWGIGDSYKDIPLVEEVCAHG